ncbi:WD40-repeat-containing domain protein [Tricladium varicosporioides]|nr:WD40-repeat-containing domain protein [Hymenoscyphus varicosporioides]
MRLLQYNSAGQFSLTDDLNGDSIPKYAILSHTWRLDTEEVTFEDMINSTGEDKPGYEKIRFCGEQAREDGLLYFWIDTCCINKGNGAELSRSITSMFRWYQKAAKCYVYLSDVSARKRKASDQVFNCTWESDFRNSRWFTRGWTLQELLAPASVEFFSRERKRLGDKSSLRQLICEITNIPHSALQGDPISQFSVDERLQWIEHRQTKQEEDKVYSLLGIFNVYMLPIYGEGIRGAFKRLRREIDELQKCIQNLCLTNPCETKNSIEQNKGGLLRDSYQWILENPDFQQWRDDQQTRLLWIKGDPGKGKTMLLCGIIDELAKLAIDTVNVSFFFCQATDNHMNNATAVLRGLIYMLVNQQPSFISHVRNSYGGFEKQHFEGPNAWVILKKVFIKILEDPHLQNTYLIVDALDECTENLTLLLDLIVHTSMTYSYVKWIVSSRNWLIIEKDLKKATQKVKLSLELNEISVSEAVKTYIQFKVDILAERNDYNNDTRDAVQRYLSSNANGTFLWVALVCKELVDASWWEAEEVLASFPPGLDSLYKRMLDQIHPRTAKLCKSILAVVSTVYRPITLHELASFVDMPPRSSGDYKVWEEIVRRCGSFLTLQGRTISFVHQSAKEFLLSEASHEIFPSGIQAIHYLIFSRWLRVTSMTLRRDIYNLHTPGYAIERVKQPDPDPLAGSRYSCIYWIDHLCAWDSKAPTEHGVDLRDGGVVEVFVRKKYLYWLEALSLCRSISDGVVSMAKLEALLQGREGSSILLDHVHDARRFIMRFKYAIEKSPLQVYTSALMFSPARSLIRRLFKEEEPRWITAKPVVVDNWNACLQTLEGHRRSVMSVAFSHDSTRLASASLDNTIKIWDISNGACLQTLEGHSDSVISVVFSHDSTWLASASEDKTVKIWDASNGACLQTLEGHSGSVMSVAFSHDSTRLASTSWDKTVKVWDTNNGACLQTLEGHTNLIMSVTFSHNSIWLASASWDKTVKIWDISSGACLRTLGGHSRSVTSVTFSHDSTWLASASWDYIVKIWDISSGVCLQTLKGHGDLVESVAFSHNSIWLASASWDKTVKIWDISSGACLQTLEGHSNSVTSVTFSRGSTWLASASWDHTVKIWDISSGVCLQTLKGHGDLVKSVTFSHNSIWLVSASEDKIVMIWDASNGDRLPTLEGNSNSVGFLAFSHDSTRLASASCDKTAKIWNTSNGACLQTLKGHSGFITSVAFSHDSTRLASASLDGTVKIWDANNGTCLQTLEGHSNFVMSVTFSHNSTWLASASWDKTAKIWDTASGACLQILEGHSDFVMSVTFSHNSTWLASASWDKTAKIWDTASGACLQILEGHSDFVMSVTFSHNSTWLASASWDKTAKIWDTASGACLQTLEGHSDFVMPVTFSHNSTWLTSASWDKTVKIWDICSGACLQTLEGHNRSVTSVTFSQDSTWLASASLDNMIKIWDTNNGACLQTLDIGKPIIKISFDPTGSYLQTDIGTIALTALSSLSSNVTNVVDLRSPQYYGWALGSGGEWITYNSENWVWLPSEYRPSFSVVSEKAIGVITGNGKVWMCNFKVDNI